MTKKFNAERGNVLILILMAIVALGLLTMAITRSTTQQSDIIPAQTRDDQINRMLSYASTLGAALNQMTVNGEDPATLYTDLSLLKPGDGGFENSPTNLKLYHPLGGGITPLDASSSDANAVATDYDINPASIITGVGATDVTIGDIIFTAHISTAAYCARINEKLTGSTTVSALTTADFNKLFGGVTVTVDGANCAACVNKPRLCVSNSGGTAWGFYAALFPG